MILRPWPFKGLDIDASSDQQLHFSQNLKTTYSRYGALRAGLRAPMTLTLEINLNTEPITSVSFCSRVRGRHGNKRLTAV